MTFKTAAGDERLTVGIDLAFQTSFFRRMTASPRGVAVAILEALHAMARGGIALLVRAALEFKLAVGLPLAALWLTGLDVKIGYRAHPIAHAPGRRPKVAQIIIGDVSGAELLGGAARKRLSLTGADVLDALLSRGMRGAIFIGVTSTEVDFLACPYYGRTAKAFMAKSRGIMAAVLVAYAGTAAAGFEAAGGPYR
jgi:hypothetical protein